MDGGMGERVAGAGHRRTRAKQAERPGERGFKIQPKKVYEEFGSGFADVPRGSGQEANDGILENDFLGRELVKHEHEIGAVAGKDFAVRRKLRVEAITLYWQTALRGFPRAGQLPFSEIQRARDDRNRAGILGELSGIQIFSRNAQDDVERIFGHDNNAGGILKQEIGAVGTKSQGGVQAAESGVEGILGKNRMDILTGPIGLRRSFQEQPDTEKSEQSSQAKDGNGESARMGD